MATISNRATGRVASGGTRISKYIGVGLLAVALGVGGVLAAVHLTGQSEGVSASDIAEARAEAYVSHLESQYRAQTHSARADQMVAHFANAYWARLAEIHEARAAAMVDRFANVYGPSAGEIEAQRGEAMAARFASQYGTPLVAEWQRAQDMVDNKRGSSSLGQ